MPHIDGLALIDAVLSILRFTPVIMVTSVSDALIIVEAMKRGVTDYLMKPVDIDELNGRVRDIIRTRVLPRRALREAISIPISPGAAMVTAALRIRPVLDTVAQVKENRSSVFIQGGDGDGKGGRGPCDPLWRGRRGESAVRRNQLRGDPGEAPR
jgi:two-component system response regulator HydG